MGSNDSKNNAIKIGKSINIYIFKSTLQYQKLEKVDTENTQIQYQACQKISHLILEHMEQ